MRDFTLEAYKNLLGAIKSCSIRCFSVLGWLENRPRCGIMLRHDVDRKPTNALRIAQVEHKFEISSTYYFRAFGSSFDKNIIKQISSLGHEIGYHYEELSLAKGDYEKAIELFGANLEKVRAVAPVQTIAMHGRPFSAYDNRDLWKKYDCRDFGIMGEAYLDVDYSDMYYFTDTGRTWGETKANIRDHVDGSLRASVDSTEDLGSFITNNPDRKIAIVMHPERWTNAPINWVIQYLSDTAINIIKGFIK